MRTNIHTYDGRRAAPAAKRRSPQKPHHQATRPSDDTTEGAPPMASRSASRRSCARTPAARRPWRAPGRPCRADRRPGVAPPRPAGAAWSEDDEACAGSSTSTSTTRTCGSSAASRPGRRRRHRHRAARGRGRLSGPTGSACASTRCSTRSGGTPLVGLPRLSPVPRRAAVGEAGGPQPDRLGQGPAGAADGRAGGEGRAAAAGLHDPRADLGQHRHLAGDGGQAARATGWSA